MASRRSGTVTGGGAAAVDHRTRWRSKASSRAWAGPRPMARRTRASSTPGVLAPVGGEGHGREAVGHLVEDRHLPAGPPGHLEDAVGGGRGPLVAVAGADLERPGAPPVGEPPGGRHPVHVGLHDGDGGQGPAGVDLVLGPVQPGPLTVPRPVHPRGPYPPAATRSGPPGRMLSASGRGDTRRMTRAPIRAWSLGRRRRASPSAGLAACRRCGGGRGLARRPGPAAGDHRSAARPPTAATTTTAPPTRGEAKAVVSPTGVVVPVVSHTDTGWVVRTPCGDTATLTEGTPVAQATIVVDPGHGGTEPGAISPAGLREADVNLAVSRHLEAALEAAGRERPAHPDRQLRRQPRPPGRDRPRPRAPGLRLDPPQRRARRARGRAPAPRPTTRSPPPTRSAWPGSSTRRSCGPSPPTTWPGWPTATPGPSTAGASGATTTPCSACPRTWSACWSRAPSCPTRPRPSSSTGPTSSRWRARPWPGASSAT